LSKPSPVLHNRTPTLGVCSNESDLRYVATYGFVATTCSTGPRATSFACLVTPARVIRFVPAFRRLALHRLAALATASLELSFPSALAGHAALLGLPRRELSRFDVRRPRGFSLSEGQSRPPQVPAAWPRDSMTFCRFTFTARRGSCIAAFIPAMFRYPRTELRDLVGPESPKRRDRALIFWWGKFSCAAFLQTHLATCGRIRSALRTSRSLGAEDKASAHLQARVRGRRLDRRHSWVSDPSQVCSRCGWRDVSVSPGLRAVRRSFAAINFRRGTVRPKGNRYSKKDERS